MATSMDFMKMEHTIAMCVSSVLFPISVGLHTRRTLGARKERTPTEPKGTLCSTQDLGGLKMISLHQASLHPYLALVFPTTFCSQRTHRKKMHICNFALLVHRGVYNHDTTLIFCTSLLHPILLISRVCIHSQGSL